MANLCPPAKYGFALDLYEIDPYDGLVELENLSEKYPQDVAVRYALGTGYLDVNQPYEALPHLEWVAKRELTPERRDALVAAYLRSSMPVHAERMAKRDVGFASGSSLAGIDISMADFPDSMATKDRLAFERVRFDVFNGDVSAIGRAQALSERVPEYIPARNLVATAAFMLGDMVRYKAAADAALRHDPGNLFALLNSVRLALLEGGFEAARALREQVIEAREHSDLVGAEVARARALAYMDDAAGARRALAEIGSMTSADERRAMEVVSALERYLDEHEADADAPLLSIEELLGSYLGRWSTLDQAVLDETLAADLAGMPGLVGLLPRLLGYESPKTARFLAVVLLSGVVPPAGPEPWSAVVQRVAQHGPGSVSTRVMLLSVLVELGQLPAGEALTFEGRDAGIEVTEVEISHERPPSGMSADDHARLETALLQMQEGEARQAMAELKKLHGLYPEVSSVTFNLALSEQMVGEDAAERWRPRLDQLVLDQPDFLLAKAHLALVAIEEGDMARAGELLRLPETKRRFYVVEYAAFTTATGSFMLEKGDVDGAQQALHLVGKLVGTTSAPYRALEGRIVAYLHGVGPAGDPLPGAEGRSVQGRAPTVDGDPAEGDPA